MPIYGSALSNQSVGVAGAGYAFAEKNDMCVPASPIAKSLDDVANEANRLQSIISDLRGRLDPVLASPSPNATGNGPDEPPPLSRMEGSLREHRASLSCSIFELLSIIERLRL